MKIESIAKTCHEVNRAYCESIGDHSQVPWEDAPDWQKESAKQGVQYYLDNPEVTPEMSHKSWLAVKEEDGWVYGEEKDLEAKTHPCMVPYDELPKEQQMKDFYFGLTIEYCGQLSDATVKKLLEVAKGYGVEVKGKPKKDELIGMIAMKMVLNPLDKKRSKPQYGRKKRPIRRG